MSGRGLFAQKTTKGSAANRKVNRVDFKRAHMTNWLPAFAERAAQAPVGPFYPALRKAISEAFGAFRASAQGDCLPFAGGGDARSGMLLVWGTFDWT